jgi:hypothetical protein
MFSLTVLTNCCIPLPLGGSELVGAGPGAKRQPPRGPDFSRNETSSCLLQNTRCPWCPGSWSWTASRDTTSSSATLAGNPEAMCLPGTGHACVVYETRGHEGHRVAL